jgi:hypothetical protein
MIVFAHVARHSTSAFSWTAVYVSLKTAMTKLSRSITVESVKRT